MRTGKISESMLKRSVLKKCRAQHPQVVQGAGVGHDCAIFSAEKERFFSGATQAIVADETQKVRYGVEHAVNNLACSGCLPVAVLLSLLLPADAQEADIKAIMQEADAVCAKMGIQVAGGHTEVTSAVCRPVLSVTAIGTAGDDVLAVSSLKGNLDLLMTGTVATQGCAWLIEKYEQRLLEKFPLAMVEQAKSYGRSASVLEAARQAKRLGAVCMHDVSQGGVFGALWEMCEGGRTGMEVDLRKIPVKQEVIEICEFFGRNPYCMLSGGALLIAAREGNAMAAGLKKCGIDAVIIGRTADTNDRLLINGEDRRFLERPAQDEIFAALSEGQGEI